MALVDITNKIIADAEVQARDIVLCAEEDAKARLVDAETRAQEYEEAARTGIERTLQDNERKISASATHEVKMSLENVRAEGIDTAFTRAQSAITALDDAAYGALIEKLLETLPEGTHGSAYVPESRIAVTQKTVAKKGFDLALKPGNIAGGLRIESDTCDFDLSVESLLAQVREQHEVVIAETLFKD